MQTPPASSAAAISALLLLALAGGFLFAYFCHLTRFPFRRMEGQQLYLGSAAAAVLLLVLSRLTFYAFKYGVLGQYYGDDIRHAWTSFLGPLEMPGLLAASGGAFLLGPISAWLINLFLFSRAGASYFALQRYGSELEKFAYASFVKALPVSVTLDNQKVYVGWPTEAPVVEPRRYVEDYLKLYPIKSGYRSDENLRLTYTTHYDKVYRQIMTGKTYLKPDGNPLSPLDFIVVIPVDKIVSVSFHAVDLTDPILGADSFEEPMTRSKRVEGGGREP